MSKVLYIVNPGSHGGAGRKTWEGFQDLWGEDIDPMDVKFTQGPDHAREIASSCGEYEVIAGVGGDGTLGEIVSGVMERENHRPKVAVIPGGTGNDLSRHAGIFSLADAVAALQRCRTRSIDLIRIDCHQDGESKCGYGCLFGNAGFSTVPMLKPWMKRWLGAKGAYFLATFLQVLVYRPPRMSIKVDGKDYDGRYYMLIAANSEWASGGSMRIAPGALVDDGQLDITLVPGYSRWKILTRLFPRISSGAHVFDSGVSYFPGKEVEVDCEPAALVDVDGDLFGMTPARISVCPGALQLVSF